MEKGKWHDKNYKKLLIIPVVLMLFSIGYLINFNSENGDFFHKDVSLTGGTSITVFEKMDVSNLEELLVNDLEDLTVRRNYDVFTGEQVGFVIETVSDVETTKNAIEENLGIDLIDGENSNIVSTGSSFSEGFQQELMIAILIAFIFMALVIFIIFKTFVPSMAVIISAFANIVMALTVFNMIGLKMSTAGIAAFLMLIGYSVDTDVLLTTRILKRRNGTLNQRIMSSMKTGMTMTLTSLFAFVVALLITQSFSTELSRIFTILVIGLGFDLVNTWVGNVSILKWYAGRKK